MSLADRHGEAIHGPEPAFGIGPLDTPDHLIDRRATACSDPETDAFENLARIAIGDRGAVTAP